MSEPLFLQSVMQEKIWGGTHLRDVFGYDIPSDHVGEYWAISAHPNGVSTIKNGRYAGQTLDVLYAEHRELFGNRQEPVFPLLTKILDANDWLSVQVHPDDAYGLEHEGELGKTECWYIIDAEPGAEIIYGHNAKSKEELRQQIESKDWENLLTKVPARAGDFFAVYKWEISGKADFEKTADYSLFSVLDGQGSLLVDNQEYPIAKGSHFILPSDVEAWQIKGNLELIVSHP